MLKEGLVEELKTVQKFFLNTVSCFTEEDSAYKPCEDVFTVAQLVGHVAETLPWFIEGAFGEKGFDMDPDGFKERIKNYVSFDACINDFKKNVGDAIEKISSLSEEELMAPITGEIMTGAPKMSIISGITDHTAHHRGALAVYARLMGKTPKMPYAD